MKHSLRQQRGLTLISIAFILGLIAFFTLLTLKIAPIYMNHSKVVNALSALEGTTAVERMSKREIQSILNKRFDMNYVDKVGIEDITITKRPNYVKVEAEYERVEKIAGNLSVLVEFYEVIEVGQE